MKKYKWQIIAGSIAAAVLLIVLMVYIAKRNKNNRVYENFDVIGKATEFSETSEVHYLPSAKGVFRYTRDGAEIIDTKGKTVVMVTYNMNKPSGDTCGNAAAVGEIGGKALVILDPSGEPTHVTTAFPIVKVQVASQGVTAVWMNDGASDYIQLYNADGSNLVSAKTLVATSGFPVDIALSNDGSKLVTAFASFKEEHLQTQLSFYNFGDVGGNYVDGLVAVQNYKDEMIADVEFIDNDTVVAFGDTGFRIFDMEEIADLRHEIKVDDPIRTVSCSDKYIGIILENNSKGGNYLLRVYGRDGKLLDEKGITEGYSSFRFTESDAVLFNDSELYIFRVGGKDKIRIELRKNLSYVASLDGVNEFLFVGDTFLERVRLVGEKK